MAGPVKFLALVATVVAASTIRRDATFIINDINDKLSPLATQLVDDIAAFPARGLAGALTIHQDFQEVTIAFNTATVDTKNTGPLSQQQGLTILEDLNLVIPIYIQAFAEIAGEKPDFDNLQPISGSPLVLQDLQTLNASVIAFSKELIANAPLTQVPAQVAAKNELEAALDAAIAEYSI